MRKLWLLFAGPIALMSVGCGSIVNMEYVEGVWYGDCYTSGSNGARSCYILTGENKLTLLTRTWIGNTTCPGTHNTESEETGVFILRDDMDDENTRQVDFDLSTNSDIFDLIKKVSETTLSVGEKSGANNGTTAELRPTAAETIIYTKQTANTDCSALGT